ncbi:MAG: dienelactone hydrolase family protein [Chloroflexi bacterium]|nr:dienelactone hydrolase family protein [Chloroflexota bacterium]
MEPRDLPLHHLVRQAAPGHGSPPLLVLFHGYGSNEEDLFGLTPYIDPRFLVLSARAPLVLMPGMFAWFEIGFTPDGAIAVDDAQARRAAGLTARFVEEAVTAYHADPSRVIVAGFSQGGTMAALTTFARPDLVAGTAVLSGIVPADILDELPDPAGLAAKPFLVLHGTADQVVSVAHGRATRDVLQQLGVALTYREFPMAHEISLDALLELTAWLGER